MARPKKVPDNNLSDAVVTVSWEMGDKTGSYVMTVKTACHQIPKSQWASKTFMNAMREGMMAVFGDHVEFS